MTLKNIYLTEIKRGRDNGIKADKKRCRQFIGFLKKEMKKTPERFSEFSIECRKDKSILTDRYGDYVAEFGELSNIYRYLKKEGVSVSDEEECVLRCTFL